MVPTPPGHPRPAVVATMGEGVHWPPQQRQSGPHVGGLPLNLQSQWREKWRGGGKERPRENDEGLDRKTVVTFMHKRVCGRKQAVACHMPGDVACELAGNTHTHTRVRVPPNFFVFGDELACLEFLVQVQLHKEMCTDGAVVGSGG